jgi:hypothetical protein
LDGNIYAASNPSRPLVPGAVKWVAAAPQYTTSGAQVFGLGLDDRIYVTSNSGGGWSPYELFGNPLAHYGQLSIGVTPDGASLEAYGIGLDGNIYAASNPSRPLVPGAVKWVAAAPQYTTSGALVFGLGLDDRIYVTSNGGSGGGAAPAAQLGQEHLTVALAEADSPLSHSPANELPPPQSVWESTPSPREQKALADSTVDSRPGFAERYALDTLFAAHHKESQRMDPDGWDAFTAGLSSGLH